MAYATVGIIRKGIERTGRAHPGNGAGDITPGKGKQPAVAAQLEEERGKNKKLTAQLNKDFENSSIPSSK